MTQSLWLHTALPFQQPQLKEDVKCDVCIVGGGLSGIYSAYLLAKAGFHVVLLEARHIASGATGLSTGKLSSQQDAFYTKLLEQFSLDEAKLYFQCQKQAIAQATQLAKEPIITNVASTLYATTVEGATKLQKEFDAYKLLDITSKLHNNHELPIETKATLTVEHDAQIHPVRFTQQLATKAIYYGAKLYNESRVNTLHPQQKKVTIQNGRNVHYKHLLLCTHYPIETLAKLNVLKFRVERSFLVATKVEERLSQQYLSIEQPDRSIRTATIDHEHYMIMAGYNLPAGSKKDSPFYYASLQNDLKTNFHLEHVPFKWSSQDVETPDLLPYIGPIHQNDQSIFIATGYRKWGLANSLIAGELLLAYLTKNPLVEKEMALFSPHRTAFGKLITQAIHVGATTASELIGGYVTRQNAPRCTHLGCKTRWNEADETWDCPCHGSRYSKSGNVLEDPAVYPLDL